MHAPLVLPLRCTPSVATARLRKTPTFAFVTSLTPLRFYLPLCIPCTPPFPRRGVGRAQQRST